MNAQLRFEVAERVSVERDARLFEGIRWIRSSHQILVSVLQPTSREKVRAERVHPTKFTSSALCSSRCRGYAAKCQTVLVVKHACFLIILNFRKTLDPKLQTLGHWHRVRRQFAGVRAGPTVASQDKLAELKIVDVN